MDQKVSSASNYVTMNELRVAKEIVSYRELHIIYEVLNFVWVHSGLAR